MRASSHDGERMGAAGTTVGDFLDQIAAVLVTLAPSEANALTQLACFRQTHPARRGTKTSRSMAQATKALQQGGEVAPVRAHGDNAPQPVRSLRDWLDHLAARDRLVVLKPGIGLRFELAAVAKRLD